jgi:hypothetical protein
MLLHLENFVELFSQLLVFVRAYALIAGELGDFEIPYSVLLEVASFVCSPSGA